MSVGYVYTLLDNYPCQGITFDSLGNLYFNKYGTSSIYVIMNTSSSVFISNIISNELRIGNIYKFGSTLYGSESNGDGNNAYYAKFGFPVRFKFDTNDNMYISDNVVSNIRKISNDGTIITIAGDDANGYSGIDYYGDYASLNIPYGLAIDNLNIIYIADSANNVIRKLKSSYIIEPPPPYPEYEQSVNIFAGTSMPGSSPNNLYGTWSKIYYPNGVCMDNNNNNVFIADTMNACIKVVNSNNEMIVYAGKNNNPGYSGDGQEAILSQLLYPTNVILDNENNLYIADTGNNVIRKVDTNGYIYTIVGTGVSRLVQEMEKMQLMRR